MFTYLTHSVYSLIGEGGCWKCLTESTGSPVGMIRSPQRSVVPCPFWIFDDTLHIKSSSSTTSRELQQQFEACSGWDDNGNSKPERVYYPGVIEVLKSAWKMGYSAKGTNCKSLLPWILTIVGKYHFCSMRLILNWYYLLIVQYSICCVYVL